MMIQILIMYIAWRATLRLACLRRRRLRLSLRLRATAGARAAAADPGGPRRDSESDGHHRLAAGTRRVGLGDGGSSEQSMIVIVCGGLYRGQRSGV